MSYKMLPIFSNRMKIFLTLHIIYLLGLFKLVHYPYTKEIFENTKRFTLHPIVNEMGGKKGSQKAIKIA